MSSYTDSRTRIERREVIILEEAMGIQLQRAE